MAWPLGVTRRLKCEKKKSSIVLSGLLLHNCIFKINSHYGSASYFQYPYISIGKFKTGPSYPLYP